MKKNILSLCLFIAFGTSLFAQDVPEVQKTLVTKITATWCPNCGTWGWDYFEYAIEDNSDKAVFVGAHHSGDLESAAGSAFSSNFMAPYQPFFYAGNVDMNVTNNNTTAKRTELKEIIDANAIMAPIANVGFLASIFDNALSIDTKVKFFQEAEGDYYLGVYILEHDVVNKQSSNSNMALHPYVIRTALTDTAFGDVLANGMIAIDSEFTQNFSLQLNPNWDKDKISVAGIIWEKDSAGNFQFVNVNATDDFTEPTAVETISSDILKIDLYPTIAENSAQLDLNLSPSSLQVDIRVFNQQGQSVQEVFQGNLNSGAQTMNIETSRLNSGVYYVSVRAENGAVLTKKLIVR